MKRRNFIKNTAAAAVIGVIIPATSDAATEKKEVIAHSVLFWLKEGSTDQDKKDFTQFFEELRKVPTVKLLQYGPPAPTTKRDVVDNSFTYNLLVYFDNMDDLNVYETHPYHLAAIEKFSKYWDKVVVHDSILR